LSGDQSDDEFSKERADLFEALSHPIRMEILHALSDSPLGFSDLKRKVNVTSSGHLTHHLEKLDGLVMTNSDGLYQLTDDGREAIRLTVRSVARPSAARVERMNLLTGVLAISLVVLIVLGSFTVLTQQSLQGQVRTQQDTIQNLLKQLQSNQVNASQLSNLEQEVAQLQSSQADLSQVLGLLLAYGNNSNVTLPPATPNCGFNSFNGESFSCASQVMLANFTTSTPVFLFVYGSSNDTATIEVDYCTGGLCSTFGWTTLPSGTPLIYNLDAGQIVVWVQNGNVTGGLSVNVTVSFYG
jgi:DNA-binding transcriptional ArsR family regulator